MTVNPGKPEMKQGFISEEEARTQLRILCEAAGGVGALAKSIGLTISAVSQQLHGHKPIHGKVAEHMGLRVQRKTKIYYKAEDHADN